MIGRALTRVALACIAFYKRWISPILPPMCRYEPTCSAYMRQAIERKGFWRGLCKGLWRICRCHPLARGGWDPVDPDDRPTYLGRDTLEDR